MNVALYARVSTTKQADKELSIPDQFRQMRDWCERQGYSVAFEYEEPGASATDDRRPEFQKMIREACVKPSPFDAVIVHSFSRFFRDFIEFALYERNLNKFGVRVISITQQTSDDAAGEMARRMFSLFDEYQSKENAKHTLRAMKENARQGFFNGSNPPYGYLVVPVEFPGRKGKKKRLEINPEEASLVRRVFELYINGQGGNTMGMSQIAAYLNEQGITRRGRRWSKSTIADLLNNSAYIGEYYFNKKVAKSRTAKEKDDWVLVSVPAIIEEDIFAQAEDLREKRSPENTPPRVINSPTLLTGLLRCSCGASMTIATGKGGRYRYYKCTSRINTGTQSCRSKNLPMDRLDQMILDAMAEKIFTPSRVNLLLDELRSRLKSSTEKYEGAIRELEKELDDVEQAIGRLYEAVEKGLLSLDESLKDRMGRHEARKKEVLARLASVQRQKTMPNTEVTPKTIEVFCQALRKKFRDREANFGKEYLRLLVEEIRVEGHEVRIRGSYGALTGMLQKTKVGLPEGVPTFGVNWLPGPDSNQRQGG